MLVSAQLFVEHGPVAFSSGREVEFSQEGPMMEASGHHIARSTRGMRMLLPRLKLQCEIIDYGQTTIVYTVW